LPTTQDVFGITILEKKSLHLNEQWFEVSRDLHRNDILLY
jgi:hypothetical protein